MKTDIILIGGGGHCKSCIDVIERQGVHRIKGILDLPANVGGNVLGYPVIGTDNDLEKLSKTGVSFLITLGHILDPKKRKNIFEILTSLGAAVPLIVSPSAYVSRHASIDGGTIIMHSAIVNAGARVGRNCIINTRALVEHDASIGDHCHISTGAIINGGTKIGDGTFFGSGAVSRELTQVADNSFVKANTVAK